MTRNLGTPQTTLQLMREARKNCAKVVPLVPRKTDQSAQRGPARVINSYHLTKSRSCGWLN